MKIESSNTKPQIHKIRDLLKRRKWLALWMAGSIGAMGAVIIFFAVFNYGGYLYQAGQTQYYKQLLKDVSKLDFSFITKYAEGRIAELDEVKIDLKFKHLLRIQYLREEANNHQYIASEIKEEEFPAKLTFNGQTHNVKLSLSGKVTRTHLGNPDKWSFQVKVKGDDTIEGMKRFGLLVPTARGHLTDWMCEELLRENGLIGLRIDFVNVSINGKSTGVYYLEERFDKYLIENNRMREGIIFKLEKDVLPYREAKLMADPATREQLLMLKRMWQDVMAGHLSPEQFFDLEKLAKVFVITDLFASRHPLSKENLRFYFNPVTGLAEPIAREFEDVGKTDPATLRTFFEEPQPYTDHFWRKRESILSLIYDNETFKRLYIREAARVGRKEFLDDFFAENKDKIDAVRAKLYRSWPYYKLPSTILYANQQKIREAVFPQGDAIAARYVPSRETHLSIELKNLQDLPLEVTHLSWKDSLRLLPADQPSQRHSPMTIVVPEAIAGEGPGKTMVVDFQMPAGVSPDDKFLAELKLHYNMLGLQPGKRTVPVSRVFEDREQAASSLPGDYKANYNTFSFIEENGTALRIPAGKWTFNRDLIIPAHKQLQIEAGAVIDLRNSAKMISYAPVFALGSKESPITIGSSDGSGEGLIVLNASKRSRLLHTHFDELSAADAPAWPEKGVVVFYKSPVEITSCTFAGNQRGEHFLSVFGTDFFIGHSRFANIRGTALSAARSTGVIQQSSFAGVGSHGLELLESRVNLFHVFMKDITGQGLSAGSDSQVEARWLDIRQADIGILSKDRSAVRLFDAQVKQSRIGLAVLQEKPDFGPAFASAERFEVREAEIPFLLEEHSTLIIDGAPLTETRQAAEKTAYEKTAIQ